MIPEGQVTTRIDKAVAHVHFGHPRSNSLPGKVLNSLAEQISAAGVDPAVRVVLIRSEGDRAFCAGASFDELAATTEPKPAHEFFMGFARVILAIRNCPALVVARVQGKAVGGGVGLIAACDYALALDSASIRLSEYALGFGPFVISPAVQRKIGLASFSALTIDSEWRDAAWGKQAGLYADTFSSLPLLDGAVTKLTEKLAASNKAASEKIKAVLWAGTEQWDTLLAERAQISAELLCSPFVQSAIKVALKNN